MGTSIMIGHSLRSLIGQGKQTQNESFYTIKLIKYSGMRFVCQARKQGLISIGYISWLLEAHGEKSGVYKAKQGGILKPALLCRDYP